MIKTIFLDLEDTIYPFEGSEAKALAEEAGVRAFCGECNVNFEEAFIAFYAVVDAARAEPDPCRNDRGKWFERLGERMGCAKNNAPEKAVSAYLKTLLSNIKPFPDALAVLPWLAKNFDVRLASEGMKGYQIERLKALKLEKYFSAVRCADECGLLKTPAFYKKMALDAGVRPGEAVMIGNSLRSDIGPAAKAGLKTIWINRFFEGDAKKGFARSFYHAKKMLMGFGRP